jgi:acetyl-CoA carboxylase carboxyl transferase beta subunit/acetyl-CoA carboxylase carboxyl transferase alpha subunit
MSLSENQQQPAHDGWRGIGRAVAAGLASVGYGMTGVVPSLEDKVEAEADWVACRQCRALLYRKRFERLAQVCPDCGCHHQLTALWRLAHLVDAGSAVPIESGATVHDPLEFTDRVPYPQRLAAASAETGMADTVHVVRATVRGRPSVIAVMDFRFLGGSLGAAAGEAIVAGAEAALAERLPLIIVTASGGARMQEGAISLMQMAKTANAMAALDEAGLLTITLVTDPTFGGVAASFATLSDVIIAEPGARMGFAGRRVIEQTIAGRLPDRFQTAELLLEHGLVDDVISRLELPHTISLLLAAQQPADREPPPESLLLRDPDLVEQKPVGQVLKLARDSLRPTVADHIAAWCDSFVPLHGDRASEDCPAVIGGIADLGGTRVMLIGHQKGHTTDELVRNNFGMASPAGYRKAIRLMRLAAKLRLPLVSLVDTPGAQPGVDAERHGQAHAIAECLRVMGGLPVPVLSVILGEGGSGGAIALAAANRVLMLENAIYSVISPEGCAAILWRRPEATAEATAALRLDARSLLRLGVVDGVVREPEGGAHTDPARATGLVGDAVRSVLHELEQIDSDQLVAMRRARFREFGRIQ